MGVFPNASLLSTLDNSSWPYEFEHPEGDDDDDAAENNWLDQVENDEEQLDDDAGEMDLELANKIITQSNEPFEQA